MSGDELPEIVVPPPGPRSRALADRMAAVESPAFDARRQARGEASGGEDFTPIVYASGRGSNLVDVDGNRYVDLTAGFGALLLGHPPHPASVAAQKASEELLLALGDVHPSAIKVEACEAIAGLFPEPGARVMLGLSGADAVTGALKTALLATSKPGVVAFHGSYHGLSHGPLAALGFAPGFREPFAAHLGIPVTFADFPAEGDPAALERSLSQVRAALAKGEVGAILVEPILGRGGCVVPPAAFLPALRALADESGALLVVDEIWTGLGRSGALLASHPVVPDVLCLGKGLGGGLPISACVGRASVMEAWGGHGGTRIHTGTHFGAPPGCAAALATITTVREQGLADRARTIGDAWRAELATIGGVTVRGRGLMVGISLASGALALRAMARLLQRGFLVLTGGTGGATLTLSPALTVAPTQLRAFRDALAEVV